MLSLQHITKRFDDVVALDDVSATIRAGSVHGVLGENGAGKTTLMRIAAGMYRPDAGTVRLGHRDLPFGSPVAATQAGIGMVHQHFMLVPTLTVVENCLLGRRDQGQFLSRRRTGRTIRDIGERIGLQVDPDARIDTLSVGEQQRVEIIRALSSAGRMLILDEPTAVLTPQEAEELFAAMDRLRRDGIAIVFISHKLAEVERICDELTILRRGRRVYTGPATISQNQMAEYMCGPGVSPALRKDTPRTSDPPTSPPSLTLDSINARDPSSTREIHEIRLLVRPGEILGIAGVEGNGQDVLSAVIVGMFRPRAGRILFDGRDVTRDSVRVRATSGLAHIPEDRLKQALVPAMTLPDNLILKTFRSERFARAGLLRRSVIHDNAVERMARFDVRGGSPATEARQLSGGNQQKLVLARELDGEPRVIIAHNPVRGLDIAATRFVFDQLLAQRERGAGILLIHSDLDELLAISDRVAVMFGGRLIPTDWPSCDRAAIGRMMLGGAS